MHRRLLLIVLLLVALALACTRKAPVRLELPRLQSSTASPIAPAAVGTPTQGEVFIPEVSSGAEETQPVAAQTVQPQAEAPLAATPQVPAASASPNSNAGAGQAQPAQTETPQALAASPTPNVLYLPLVDSGQAGEAAESTAALGPSIQLEANPVILRVGETLTVVGRPSGIGMPYYDLMVQDQGAQQAQSLGRVTYENATQPQGGASQVLELVSAQGQMDVVTFVLRAKAPGTAAVQITATGEVQTESGAFTWSGGSSQAIAVTVTGE